MEAEFLVVASRALPRGRLIKQDTLTLSGPESCMTKIARNLLVRAF